MAAEAISAGVGYENPGFSRALFRRRTGLIPGKYRRMFQPFALSPNVETPRTAIVETGSL
jgi:transcriptional regulator GlxA family with amidase domain